MSRLIDADILLDILDLMIVGHKSAGDVYDVVDSMPTVDAVEVVRCKDCCHCIHNEFFDTYCCWKFSWSIPVEKDSFCSWGERREDERK